MLTSLIPTLTYAQSKANSKILENFVDSLGTKNDAIKTPENLPSSQYLKSHFSIKPDKLYLFFTGQIFSCNFRSEKWTHQSISYFLNDINKKVNGFLEYSSEKDHNLLQDTLRASQKDATTYFNAGKSVIMSSSDCDANIRIEASKIDSIIGYVP